MKKLKLGHFTFGNWYIQGAPRMSNITASFAVHLNLQEKLTFAYALWVNSSKSK